MKTEMEQALELVQDMVDHGWKLVDETAEEWLGRMAWNLDWLRGIAEAVRQWPQ